MSLIYNTEIIQSLIEKIESLPNKTNEACTVVVGALASSTSATSILYYIDSSGVVATANYSTGATLTVKKDSLLVAFNCSSASSVSGATLLHYDSVVAAYLINNDATLTFG